MHGAGDADFGQLMAVTERFREIGIYSSVGLADFDGDGRAEIVAGERLGITNVVCVVVASALKASITGLPAAWIYSAGRWRRS